MAHPKRRQSKTRTLKRRTHDKAVAPTLAVCPNCGAEISRENQFCPKCGQQIVRVEPAQPKKNVCPKCGAEVAEGAMFCGSCGAKLDTAAEDNIVDPAEPAQDVTETQNKD